MHIKRIPEVEHHSLNRLFRMISISLTLLKTVESKSIRVNTSHIYTRLEEDKRRFYYCYINYMTAYARLFKSV